MHIALNRVLPCSDSAADVRLSIKRLYLLGRRPLVLLQLRVVLPVSVQVLGTQAVEDGVFHHAD